MRLLRVRRVEVFEVELLNDLYRMDPETGMFTKIKASGDTGL